MKKANLKYSFEKENCCPNTNSIKKPTYISTTVETFQSECSLPLNLSSISDWKLEENLNGSYEKIPDSVYAVYYKRALKKIVKLNEEIGILSHQLKLSNKEIEKLNRHIHKIKEQHAVKLQFMQEQHEKKMQKTKSDLDFLLKDLNMKSTVMFAEQFIKKHTEELEILKKSYEKDIEEVKSYYESEMILKELEQEKSLTCLKTKFFMYAKEIEKKFKKKIYDFKLANSKNVKYCKEYENSRVRVSDVESDQESVGFDSDNELFKHNCSCENFKVYDKLPIQLIERISCGSLSSLKRESR